MNGFVEVVHETSGLLNLSAMVLDHFLEKALHFILKLIYMYIYLFIIRGRLNIMVCFIG